MGEWEPLHLHWSFKGEHVLFPFLVLRSFKSFLLASFLLVVICTTERLVTSYHDRPQGIDYPSARLRSALWRCLLYWIAMMLRLFYMLAAMTFNLGLIAIIATTLASTQLILDLRSDPRSHFTQVVDNEPFLPPSASPASTFVALESVAPKTRPRSKSKPDGIFIHPAESNIARADVLAMQLGISGNTERVHGNFYDKPQSSWQTGKGRDVARELLSKPGPTNPPAPVPTRIAHQRSGSFQIGSSSESEDESSDEYDNATSEVRRLVPS